MSGMTKGKAPTLDSIQNYAARLGAGPGSDNVSSAATYMLNPISRNRILCDNLYRGSWLARQGVVAIPDDMTRAGVTINSKIAGTDVGKIQAELLRKKIWAGLNQAMKWARLYGGCIGFMMIDGQDPATPLRIETVGRGQFQGILPLDRWMLQPSMSELVTEFGPDFGSPKFYATTESSVIPYLKIHHTRAIRFDGDDLPFWQRMTENGWGLSILEPFYDRLVAFDSTTQGAAQLVFKAHLRNLYMPHMREAIAAGGDAMEAVAAQLQVIRKYQSFEGLTVLDGEDRMEAMTYSFTGLDQVLTQFAQQISGALQIPLVRLFGQSPAGLNSTGDSDIRLYYDAVSARQSAQLDVPMTTLLGLTFRSLFGAPPPDDFSHDFVPLWQITQKERAEIAEIGTRVVVSCVDSGLLTPAAGMEELRALTQETGFFANITDDMIAAAEQDPPDLGEIDPLASGKPMLRVVGGGA